MRTGIGRYAGKQMNGASINFMLVPLVDEGKEMKHCKRPTGARLTEIM